eukprot:scaffold84622_cov72-Phaeocystis_antarctica.AAC.1
MLIAPHARFAGAKDRSPPQAPSPEGDGACGGASAFTTIARESSALGPEESSLIGTTHTA